jgi:hypothetical protein
MVISPPTPAATAELPNTDKFLSGAVVPITILLPES